MHVDEPCVAAADRYLTGERTEWPGSNSRSTRRLTGVKHPRVRHAPTPVSVSTGTYRFFRPNSATCSVIECGSGRRVARLTLPPPPSTSNSYPTNSLSDELLDPKSPKSAQQAWTTRRASAPLRALLLMPSLPRRRLPGRAGSREPRTRPRHLRLRSRLILFSVAPGCSRRVII
jgi:hypothetical protein